jgi:hypothetical protein
MGCGAGHNKNTEAPERASLNFSWKIEKSGTFFFRNGTFSIHRVLEYTY